MSWITRQADRITAASRTRLGVLFAYALIVIIMSWPAPLDLSQRLIGNNLDNWIFYWNNWWFEQVIAEGQTWFYTPYLFYPQGTSLTTHSNSFLNSLLALIIKPLLGPVAAYNLVFLFGLWVSAVGMFLLVEDLTHVPSAAFLSGLIFTFAPYHLSQAWTHGHLGSIHWWPFYVLFLRRALRQRRIADAVLAGLFAALNLWSGLQLAVLLALWTVAYVGWYILRRRDDGTEYGLFCLGVIRITCLVGIIALVLSAPVVLPVAREWNRATGAIFDESMTSQTDLLAYLLPPPYHPLVGPLVRPLYERFIDNREYIPYLGFTALGLSVASLSSRRKEARFWLLSAILWIVLAAGSALRLNGNLYPRIVLPYHLIRNVFPFSAIRAPDRMNLLVAFSVAISAGLGAAELVKQRRWLVVSLGLLVFIEYLCIPTPMLDRPPDSPFLQQMAQEDTPYGVVDFPMGYNAAQRWLYYQTLHGKPTVEGHVSRYTAKTYTFINSNALLNELYGFAIAPPYLPQEDADTQAESETYVQALGPALRSLNRNGVRYILVHKTYVDDYLQGQLGHILPLVPVYDDEVLAAYDLRDPLPYSYDRLSATLTHNVALVRFDMQPTDADNSRWRLHLMAQLRVPLTHPLPCQVRLENKDEEILAQSISLFDTASSEEVDWQTGDLWVKEVKASLPAQLEPGTYRWTLDCGAGARYEAVDMLHIRNDGRTFYTRHLTNLIYEDIIRLLGYRWRTTGAELHVTLLWEALQKPVEEYKVFVHLINSDGDVVRQYDAMPCNWTCPTDQWQVGELIQDEAILSLGGLPAGEYQLAVGMYRPGTPKRLSAREPGEKPYPKGYPVLPDSFLIQQEDDPQSQ